jgi:hypothetical protein
MNSLEQRTHNGENIMCTINEAVAQLAKAGYVAEAQASGAIKVQDPYCGYRSGVYAVDGYNTVYVTPQQVSKFIDDRK